MKKLLIILPLLYFLILLFRAEQAFTQDLGRHLMLGEMILNCFCVPKTNMFSYTAPNFPFVNHHWLPEVVFYGIVQFFGLFSLLWFKIVLIIASFLPVVYLAIRRGGVILASSLAIPFIFIFSERFDVRPEIFSFVYISLFMLLLSLYLHTKKFRFLLLLPFLQILWVNSHIYFFLGPLLYIFLIADLIWNKSLTKQVAIWGIVLTLVSIVSPQGIDGALYPLRVFGNYGYSIVENQNIFFLNSFFFNPRILIFELTAIVAAILSIFLFRKKKIFDMICIWFGIVAGGMMIRNFPIFVLMAFPGVVMGCSLLLHTQKLSLQRKTVKTFLVFVTFIAFMNAIQVIKSPSFGLRYVYGAEKAADFYIQNQLPGRIFNNFDIGSYLIYRLYPDQKVFVDGRPEAYPAEFFELYKKMQTDPQLFDEQVIRYDINTVFFAHTDITPWAQDFLQSIVRDPQWVTVYLDERIIILLRNTPQNEELIRRHKVPLPSS